MVGRCQALTMAAVANVPLTAAQRGAAALSLRVARPKLGRLSVATLSYGLSVHRSSLGAGDVGAMAGGGGTMTRVKVDNTLDLFDEDEIAPLTAREITRNYEVFTARRGAPPLKHAEATSDQISTTYARIFIHQDPPYCDISIFSHHAW